LMASPYMCPSLYSFRFSFDAVMGAMVTSKYDPEAYG
jgi:hypothetical protein